MSNRLDYATPALRPPSRLLAIFAHVTMTYPLLVVGTLYGEWFLAWHVLGREPQPYADNPNRISGVNWIHPITGVTLLGFCPAICAALVANAMYAIDRRLIGDRLAFRLVAFLVLWFGVLALITRGPYPVLDWWFD